MTTHAIARPLWAFACALGFIAALLKVSACDAPSSVSPSGSSTPAAASTSIAHRFEKVADGVYAAIGTGSVNVGSNTAVIVNDDDVLIVDSHITPAAARVLVSDLKSVTDKPVKFVVDSHYHFDHAHGNQVFGPDVQIIGHEFTREMLMTDVLNQRTYISFTQGVPKQIDDLTAKAASASDAAEKEKLNTQLKVTKEYQAALAEIKPTPPNVTLKNSLKLFRGSREIQLLFFGRGHTGGDVVTFLPKERVLCTGDLLTSGLSYAGDAHVDEWIATLEAVKALEFETVIPGHGEPFMGTAKFESFQAYLKDLSTQVGALRAKGVSAADAAKQVDLTAHKGAYPQIQGPGADPRAVDRIYQLLSQ